ncbi:MAG: phosphoheptose isomerase [Bacteroidia bacterium]|nr:phosphoheptose isomerase [Bacteroidia bacterium]
MSKQNVFEGIERYLASLSLGVVKKDEARPWGGFLVINEGQAAVFADLFFADENATRGIGKLSPKILIVQPGMRLSWQYHHRRSEIWKLVAGSAGVKRSDTDAEGTLHTLAAGEVVKLACGERHRLVGLDNWGMIAEIWQHTDTAHPSDEDDIVRVQDDFGR